jgi:hypothetical protein
LQAIGFRRLDCCAQGHIGGALSNALRRISP